MARDSIALLRDVEATFIPQGGVAVVPEGTWLIMQQALGGSFTLMTERGQLVRVDGQDADALGEKYLAEAQAAATARASLGLYNTREEIDALVVGLEKVRRMFA